MHVMVQPLAARHALSHSTRYTLKARFRGNDQKPESDSATWKAIGLSQDAGHCDCGARSLHVGYARDNATEILHVESSKSWKEITLFPNSLLKTRRDGATDHEVEQCARRTTWQDLSQAAEEFQAGSRAWQAGESSLSLSPGHSAQTVSVQTQGKIEERLSARDLHQNRLLPRLGSDSDSKVSNSGSHSVCRRLGSLSK